MKMKLIRRKPLLRGNSRFRILVQLIGVMSLLLAGCFPTAPTAEVTPSPDTVAAAPQVTITPYPTRQVYSAGELVDYTVQDGDSVSVLAMRFNTKVSEIRTANPIIPDTTTTLPPGMPMKIPIYYLPFWGSSYQILPDSLFVNGPAQVDFNTVDYVNSTQGWLKDFRAYAAEKWRSGPEIVDYVATQFSVSPRLLLAILEYQTGALSQPSMPDDADKYILGYEDFLHKGLYLQLVKVANDLNNGYYGWRSGSILQLELKDGSIERIDPWQNAASAALHYYFNLHFKPDQYARAVAPDGFEVTYKALFGDPWNPTPAILIPGSLQQPDFILPFQPGVRWAFTGGPHPGYGSGEPLAALDFAPPAEVSGCSVSTEWAVAVADGVVSHSDVGEVILDLDGDGDERTGWSVMYLHISHVDAPRVGMVVKKGDPIGHPSCEGGEATGTHVHLVRRYNGEWIPAGGIIPFNLEGWVAAFGSAAYEGTLTKYTHTVRACTCSDGASQLTAGSDK
jgi:LysM repeat protein